MLDENQSSNQMNHNNCSPIPMRFLRSPRKPNSSLRQPKQKEQQASSQQSALSSVKKPRRKPLGFLSPNIKNSSKKIFARTSSHKRAKQQHHAYATHHPHVTFSTSAAPSPEHHETPLRREVAGLRRRIQLLDNNDHHTVTDEQRDNELSDLNEKLELIQRGLTAIDSERQGLTESAVRLRDENEQLRKELSMRERESASLAKRCSSQAEKMKEATLLRSAKLAIEKQVQSLQQQLEAHHESTQRSKSIQFQLEECRESRNELKRRLAAATIENDKVVESLSNALLTAGRLTEEKQAWEEERRTLNQRIELDRQSQHLEHLQETIDLREDLRAKNQTIEHLQNEGREKLELVTKLRNDISDLKKRHQDELQSVSKHHEKALLDQSLENANKIDNIELHNRKTLAAVHDLINDREATIDLLRSEVSSRMQEVMQMSTNLEKLKEDTYLVEGLTADVEALEAELTDLKEGTLEKDTAVAELEAEILKLEIEKELLVHSSDRAACLEREITSLTTEREAVLKSMEDELESVRETVRSLEAKLKREQKEHTARQRQQEVDHETIAASLRQQIASLNKELLDSQLKEKDATTATCTKDETIESLRGDLRRLGDEFLVSTQTHGSETKALRRELQSLKTELALRGDEIRDIRLIEMHEQEEIILGLRKDTIRLHEIIKEKDEQLETGSDELGASLARHRQRCADLEARLADKVREHQAVIDSMTESSVDMQRKLDWKETTIQGLERKLQELTSQSHHLANTVHSSETELLELRSERQKLRQAEKSAKADRDNFKLALERQSDQVNQLEDVNTKLRERYQKLEADAINSANTVAVQEERIAMLQEDMRDRSRILSDMIATNKSMEGRLAKENSSYGALAEESSELMQQLAEKDGELRESQSIWTEREDRYIEDLQLEKNRREIAERSLKALQSKVEAVRQENKDSSELEKENQALKDKVRRQEIYLKRKLEKDKVLRDRSLHGNSVPTPTAATISGSTVKPFKTPARSSTGVGSSSCVRASRIPTPHVQRVSVSTPNLLDEELDELLAD